MLVSLKNVNQSYGNRLLFENLNLEIPSGKFFSLLGPSGCGKTTLLRMLAGFIRPDSGAILFGERDVTRIPVHRRNIGMVFQDYALFPDRTVLDNVSYGLLARGIHKKEAAKRSEAMLAQVGLAGFAPRMPAQLSGGQKQRVAMARALVISPEVLLLDEPLSALDVKLRVELRLLIRALQVASGITTVFVTHDQSEALAMSDEIAVLKNGRIMQLGSPFAIHDQPSCAFVAEFLGLNQIPITGELGVNEAGLRRFTCAEGVLLTDSDVPLCENMTMAVRPTDILIEDALDVLPEGSIAGIIEQSEFRGATTQYIIRTAVGLIQAEVPTLASRQRQKDENVRLVISSQGRLVGEVP